MGAAELGAQRGCLAYMAHFVDQKGQAKLQQLQAHGQRHEDHGDGVRDLRAHSRPSVRGRLRKPHTARTCACLLQRREHRVGRHDGGTVRELDL